MKKKRVSVAVVLLTFFVLVTGTVFLFSKSTTKPGHTHQFGDWEVTRQSKEFSPGERVRECFVCSLKQTERINAESSLPQLYLSKGVEAFSKGSAAPVAVDFVDSKDAFSCEGTVRNQGHASLAYPKKNYTLRLFESVARDEKKNVSIRGWEKAHEFCLKANYTDISAARTVVANRLWRDAVLSRESLPKEIKQMDGNGALDGFPVLLFIGEDYQGLYTLNVPKDDDTYRIADEPNEAMFIINEATSKSADFRALITEADYKTIYDLEYANPENEAWAYDSLNTLIRFVKENNDEPFKTGIDTYLDVDSAIDYLLALYCLGLSDNYSKNMMFWTFDGKRWIINLYDLDTAFGLAADGSRFYAPEEYLPKLRDDGTVDSGSNNLLWERLFTLYKDKLLQRYQILREGTFSNEHMKEALHAYLSDISQSCYEKEREVWPETPLANENHLAQMETYIDAHLAELDAVMTKIGGKT